MADGNVIGEFLRARRELLRPEDVGIPDVDRRRVPGLRRSELAMLAGISTEYYVRLEQGRDRHPSTLVLEALARALQLDEHATAHLHQLAAAPAPRRTRRRRSEKVSEQIDALLRSLARTTPAYVTGRLMNVLAANELAMAVLPLVVPGSNFVRSVFLDPIARELYDDIERRQAAAVAGLRAYAGPDVEDPQLTELVGELSVKSPEFRRLWSRHDVMPIHGTLPPIRIRHPQLGPIDLYHQKLEIPDTGGQILGLLYAEPGSRSEQAVAMLAATMGELNVAQSDDDPARRTQTPAEPA
jgi:transcriptional regulator with XRE-family HTH domain